MFEWMCVNIFSVKSYAHVYTYITKDGDKYWLYIKLVHFVMLHMNIIKVQKAKK